MVLLINYHSIRAGLLLVGDGRLLIGLAIGILRRRGTLRGLSHVERMSARPWARNGGDPETVREVGDVQWPDRRTAAGRRRTQRRARWAAGP